MSSTTELIIAIQLVFFLYFLALNGTYILLNVLAAGRLWRAMQERELDEAVRPFSGLEPGISLLVPAYNEEKTIVTNLHSLLQLDYPDYEIIVINDGSADSTLKLMVEEFGLVPFPESNPRTVEAKPVHTVYRSTHYANLRVIDKENGGKADSLNAGLNIARSPLFCSIDADSILQRDSLQRLVRPFLENAKTVATGGTVRIANGCDVRNGYLVRAGLPKNLLALLQIVEYLRSFLFGRMGWVPMNGMLVISGAIGLFDKKRVLEVGGYRHDTVGEDMELVVRLHRYLSSRSIPYTIDFISDPVCWTEAPEDLKTLKGQRVRWQRGLCESLAANRELLLSKRGGAAGWIAFPFMLFFEMLGPFVELFGYVFVIALWALGLASFHTTMIFLLMAVGLGILLSVSSILLEEMSFHIYPKPSHMLTLFGVAIIDNLGYRQLMSVWRLWGLIKWVTGTRGNWGKMQRSGAWNQRLAKFRARKRRPAVL